jgi:hypothetical protein
MRTKPIRVMEWGTEAQCSVCHGWWPADREFFPYIVKGTPQGACRACLAERNHKRRPLKGKVLRPLERIAP